MTDIFHFYNDTIFLPSWWFRFFRESFGHPSSFSSLVLRLVWVVFQEFGVSGSTSLRCFLHWPISYLDIPLGGNKPFLLLGTLLVTRLPSIVMVRKVSTLSEQHYFDPILSFSIPLYIFCPFISKMQQTVCYLYDTHVSPIKKLRTYLIIHLFLYPWLLTSSL